MTNKAQEQVDKDLIEKCLLGDEEKAAIKGFGNVIDWYLACINAEINILLFPELRTEDRLVNLAPRVKYFIDKLTKAIPIIKKAQQVEDTTHYVEKIRDIIGRVKVQAKHKEAEEIKRELEELNLVRPYPHSGMVFEEPVWHNFWQRRIG